MSNTFYPIVAGRISDSLNRSRSLTQLQKDQIELAKLQDQLATGQRFVRPSDDPAAAIRVLALQRQQENQKQAIVNLDSADSYLSVSETALSNLTSSLQQVKGIALEAVTNISTEADRKSLAIQIDDQISRLLSISNQQFQDRYLFSGGLVREQPFVNSANGIEFRGNSLPLETFGLEGTLVGHNVSGLAALGGLSSGVVGLADLSPAIRPETRLSLLNGGAGVTQGAIQLSDGTSIVQVDLAGAYRVSDVLDKINAVEINGRPINANLTTSGLQIDYADGNGGVLRVTNVGSGKAATDLGIETTTPAPFLPIVGNNLRPSLTLQTQLSDLLSGTGLSNSGGITIQQGDVSHSIDFAGAQTVEDVLLRINNSGAKVTASIAPDGRRLQIQSKLSGVDFSISELGSNTASLLGLKTFHGNLRLSELNHGQGIHLGNGDDLEFTRTDGTTFSVDLTTAVTVDDVITLINSHPDNQDPALAITVSLNPNGNGLQLSAAEPVLPAVGGPIMVRNAGGSQAAVGLGLVSRNDSEAVAILDAGVYRISGGDPNPQEAEGVFNTLLRLRKAIYDGDTPALERISAALDRDLDRVSLIRGQVGVQQQRIESLRVANEDQITQAAADQSKLLDTDYAEALAALNAKQVAYEASLRLLADMLKGASLFNYI